MKTVCATLAVVLWVGFTAFQQLEISRLVYRDAAMNSEIDLLQQESQLQDKQMDLLKLQLVSLQGGR